MSNERDLYTYCDFWDDCVDHFERSGNLESMKQKNEFDHLQQYFMIGQSYTKIDTAATERVPAKAITPSPSMSDESCSISEASQPTTESQLPSNLPTAPNPATISASTTTPKPTNISTTNKSLKHRCDTCSQVFDSKIALSIHTGRIHKHEGRDKNYQCKICPKAFFNSSYLAQHMRIHTGNKPYPCPDCDKRFTQLSHLQQHKRTHTGEKPYKCQQPGCNKAFSQLSNLQSHTRSHLPDGNVHKCTSCYKCYYDEASLNAHMRTHMENKRVRNYRCEECGKTYTQDTYLQNHINNKHGGGASSALEPAGGFPSARPQRQPTSIQAATSMICKMEELPSNDCGFSATRQQCDHQSPQPMQQPFSHDNVSASISAFPKVSDFSVAADGMPTTATVAAVDRNAYQDANNSAFKPVMRSAFDASVENVPPPSTPMSQSQPQHHYEQARNNLPMSEPVAHIADVKPEVKHMSPDGQYYWNMKSSMVTASSLGNSLPNNYSHLPPQIQNYMVSQANYHPYTSAYMSNTLDNLHAANKLGSSVFENDSPCDYLMGGLRDAYYYD